MTLPSSDKLTQLSQELTAAALWAIHSANNLMVELRTTRIDGVPSRTVESFAMVASMYAVLKHGQKVSVEKARSILLWFLRGRAQEAIERTSEPEALLREIFSFQVNNIPGVGALTIGKLLECLAGSPDAYIPGDVNSSTLSNALEACGLKLLRTGRGNPRRLFFDTDLVRRRLLSGSRFKESRVDQLLMRLPEAERSQQRINGSRLSGVILTWPLPGQSGAEPSVAG